jgi:manganese efflux pump family protein
MVALLLVAAALGLSNFAASIGLGAGGADAVRVAAVFGVFEAGMPVAGLALGHDLASSLGHAAHWIGGALLIAVGGYTLVSAGPSSAPAPVGWWRLLVTGLALSLDNLAAGFALGTYHVTLWLAVPVIAIVSVALSLLGLSLGARLTSFRFRGGELMAGVMLIAVGAAMAAGAL